MRWRSFVATAALAALSLLAACSALRARFPIEEEVRGRLHRGMTAEEVLATFGEPPGHHWVDVKLGGKVHYIAPVAARTKKSEGYAGFTVYFDRGKVWDWEVILMNPSYEHRLLAGRNVQVIGAVALIALAVTGFAAFRLVRLNRNEREALLNAYATSDIPDEQLPSDFRFITHDTTLQAVLERAGPYSRTRKVATRSDAGATALTAFEYELPSNGAVFVMPEPPFEPRNRVRAVFYRQPRGALEI